MVQRVLHIHVERRRWAAGRNAGAAAATLATTETAAPAATETPSGRTATAATPAITASEATIAAAGARETLGRGTLLAFNQRNGFRHVDAGVEKSGTGNRVSIDTERTVIHHSVAVVVEAGRQCVGTPRVPTQDCIDEHVSREAAVDIRLES